MLDCSLGVTWLSEGKKVPNEESRCQTSSLFFVKGTASHIARHARTRPSAATVLVAEDTSTGWVVGWVVVGVGRVVGWIVGWVVGWVVVGVGRVGVGRVVGWVVGWVVVGVAPG